MSDDAKEQEAVQRLNDYLRQQLWTEFAVHEYTRRRLVIYGGCDAITGGWHEIEIAFANPFAFMGQFDWEISPKENNHEDYVTCDVFDARREDMVAILQPEIGYHEYCFKVDNDWENSELRYYIIADSMDFKILPKSQ